MQKRPKRQKTSSSGFQHHSFCLQIILPFMSRVECKNLGRCCKQLHTDVFAFVAPRFTWTPSTMPDKIMRFMFGSIRSIKERPSVFSLLQHPPGLTKLFCLRECRRTFPIVFPPCLLTLEFDPFFTSPVEGLPPNLTELHLGVFFNERIHVLPPTLRVITFSQEYNKALPVFPDGIESITFGTQFSQPLQVGCFPSSLISLVFGHSFNQELLPDVLPSRLTRLKLGNDFNHVLHKDALPLSLTSLSMRGVYHYPLPKGGLFASLSMLSVLKAEMCQPSPGCFPDSLLVLKMGNHYFNDILQPQVLPPNLTLLDMGYSYNLPISLASIFPQTLVTLILPTCFNQFIGKGVLPINLKHLTIGTHYAQSLEKCALPPHLLSIELPDRFTQADIFPNSLKKIVFVESYPGYDGHDAIRLFLPNGLEFLRMTAFGRSLYPLLPPSLRTLFFNDFSTVIPCGLLPNSITKLNLGWGFNQVIIPGSLPSKLLSLTFSNAFNKPIAVGTFPPTITELFFGVLFSQEIDVGILPRDLIFLHIHNIDVPFPEDCEPPNMRLCRNPSLFQSFKLEASRLCKT